MENINSILLGLQVLLSSNRSKPQGVSGSVMSQDLEMAPQQGDSDMPPGDGGGSAQDSDLPPAE